ncbi:MAG: insulinase family protein [Akkermansiaceae bacterium]|nr:insulinase family protein [Akkermansiaceae bacterium]MCP5549365.1 insulinase family protein [Akkermansiaceae bacterium]
MSARATTDTAAADEAAIEFPRTTARVRTYPNGLELIVKEDRAAPVVSLQAWCRAGSIHEGDLLGSGMSHFLEHMLFKGTGKRGGNEIAQAVQAAGGYINAYTSFDRTVYWIDAPSEGFEACLDVLCDVVANARLPEDEFEKEAEVIRREFAMGDDNPDQVLSKLLFRTAFAESPCRHPVIGHLDLFNQLTRDELSGYYRRQYSPDNLFLVVAGDVDAETVHSLVEGHLGGLERRRRRHHEVIPAEPRQLGRREIHETFPTELSRVELAWHLPDVSHPDMPALDVLATIAGGGRSSRLYREVRERLGLAHGVSAHAYTAAHAGLFIVSLDTEPDKRDAAIEAALDGVRSLADAGGIVSDEMSTAVHQALSAQLGTLTTMRGQASDLGSNWILTRNLDFTRDYVEAVQRVTAEDVAGVARRYLTNDGLTIVSLNPEEAAPVKAAARSAPRSDEVRKVELANGLTLLLKADARVPLTTVHAVFRGGMLAATPETAGIGQLMARLLAKDTKRRSAEEIARQIEAVGGSLGGGNGRNTFNVTANTMRPDLDLAIDLVAESLLEPAFLPETVEREKGHQIAGIKAEDDRPFSVAMLRLRETIFGATHPYGLRGGGTVRTVRGFSPADLEALRARLVCGRNGVVAVFGDIDPGRAEDRLRERFESTLLPGAKAFDGESGNATPPLSIFVEPGPRECVLTHEKEQAIVAIGFPTGGVAAPERAALDLLDEACSDMASRVFVRIREELGLAYSVGATQLLGLDRGMILFYAATAPDQWERVRDELLGEIDNLAQNGLDPAELERARSSWLGRDVMGRQSAQQLAAPAAVDELLGLGWDHHRLAAEAIRTVEPEAIRAAAAATFVPERRAVVALTKG